MQRFSRVTCRLAIVLLATTGCVQTAMLPAHQLEDGETVAGVSLDEPGFLYVPRLNVQATQGLGGGDLTANVSGTALAVGGGLSGRYYLTDAVHLEGQLQTANRLEFGWVGAGLVGVQQAATASDPWYLGGNVGVIGMDGRDLSTPDRDEARAFPMVGASVGAGHLEVSDSWRMQVELEGHVPFGLSGYPEDVFPPVRFSIGIFRLWR